MYSEEINFTYKPEDDAYVAILSIAIAKLILICKKCKTSFKSKNKLFKHVFLNTCLPSIYKASKTTNYNLLSFDVIIANLI